MDRSMEMQSFVRFDGMYCVYRATPALGCGIAAAMFVLSGQAAVTAASGCFGRCRARRGEESSAPTPGEQRRRSVAAWLSVISWYVLILDLLPQHPHARARRR